ncbi:hypothetical protein [Brevibacillus brevis]|uniref:hypothetical protein n=1 Tax=Brevibacillus brevis TaxID=1393 RepID=UPI00115AE6DA|nr:hypothetical protein [Lysinibacillus sp. SDF0063]TQR36892.1 hypothetical protein C7Y45_13540 [Lysinibacillus sp. SDF0063]
MPNINPFSVFWSTLFEILGRNSILFFFIVIFLVLLIWLYKVSAQRSKEAEEKLIKDLSSKVIAYTELKYCIQLYLLNETTDSLEKLFKKTAEVSIFVSPHLLKRLNLSYQFKLKDDLTSIIVDIDKKVSEYRLKLSLINKIEDQHDGAFGKLLYFVSLLKHVVQPLLLALLLIATLFVFLLWLYSLAISNSELEKLFVIINGFGLIMWILSIFASLEIISEGTFSFSFLSITRIITSIILWASPVLLIFDYGGVVLIIIQVMFLWVLPRLREK